MPKPEIRSPFAGCKELQTDPLPTALHHSMPTISTAAIVKHFIESKYIPRYKIIYYVNCRKIYSTLQIKIFCVYSENEFGICNICEVLLPFRILLS